MELMSDLKDQIKSVARALQVAGAATIALSPARGAVTTARHVCIGKAGTAQAVAVATVILTNYVQGAIVSIFVAPATA